MFQKNKTTGKVLVTFLRRKISINKGLSSNSNIGEVVYNFIVPILTFNFLYFKSQIPKYSIAKHPFSLTGAPLRDISNIPSNMFAVFKYGAFQYKATLVMILDKILRFINIY